VEFRRPKSEQPVRLSGKVRHRALYLYGIEFLGESEQPQSRLQRSAAGVS